MLQKSYKDWFLQKKGTLNADNNGHQHIKVISAIIREKITAEKEERFKVIVMCSGTKHQIHCSSMDFIGSCDSHAEANCYEAVVLHFLKLIRKRDFNVLLLSKDGFQLNPEYKFHLFVSRPPCGFMTNEEDPLISWKTPFVKEPHILTCSSKIVLNSYLGVQGPLICLFAKPVYISEVIISNTTESIVEKVWKKFTEAAEKLVQQSSFSFHPPKIKVLKTLKPECIGVKNDMAQEESLLNQYKGGNSVPSFPALEKTNEKLKEMDDLQGTRTMHYYENLLHIGHALWYKICRKLDFNEFDKIYKGVIKNLMIFQELINLRKTLEKNSKQTSLNLKEKLDKYSAEIIKLVEEINYKHYKKTNSTTPNFLDDIDNLKNKKEVELRMIEDVKELIERLAESKTSSIPMCCCWKSYLTLLQKIEQNQ